MITSEAVLTPQESYSYIKALVAIACADGTVSDKEREYIEIQAAIAGVKVDSWSLSPLSELQDKGSLSPQAKALLIRDAIVLAHIDGSYDESERNVLFSIADTINFPREKVILLETWFQDYCEVLKKGIALLEGN